MDNQETEPTSNPAIPSVLISPIEAVAYYLGILEICKGLEDLKAKAEPDDTFRDYMSAILLEIVQVKKLDWWLVRFAPDEAMFKTSLSERAITNSHAFDETLIRALEIRKERDVYVEPPKATAPAADKVLTAQLSGLENFSYILGKMTILAWSESSMAKGAIPPSAHLDIAASALIGSYKAIDGFNHMIEVGKPGPLKTDSEYVELLTTEFATWRSDSYFRDLANRLQNAHDKLLPILGNLFVRDFLDEHPEFLDNYTKEESRSQIQKILYTLQDRLIARRQAIEKAEYEPRLEAIDKNIAHLLDTLKQYGIEAKTYDDARQQYERKFVPPPKPKEPINLQVEIEKTAEDLLKLHVRQDDMAERLAKKFPTATPDDIRRSVTKAMQDRLRLR